MIVDSKGKEDFHIRYWNCTNSKCGRLRRFYVWSVDEEYWIRRCSQGHQLKVMWTTWEKMNAHIKRLYLPLIIEDLNKGFYLYQRLDNIKPSKSFTIPLRVT